MELRHLRYFIAVAEELHFGRAAQRLCMAQPPLSQQIQQLERELGFDLFLRTGRRVFLTEAGSGFLEEAREILASLDHAISEGRRVARGETGWLGIGFAGSVAYGFLPAILTRYRALYPNVSLVLREMVTAKQAQALRQRRIHIGLARPPLLAEDLRCLPLAQEPLVLAVPQSHALANKAEVALSHLAEEPFILFPRRPQPSYGEMIVALCESAGFSPHSVQETAEIHTALSLVSAGVGITLVPSTLQSAPRMGVCYVPLASPVPTAELSAIYRKEEDSPALKAFIEVAIATISSDIRVE